MPSIQRSAIRESASLFLTIVSCLAIVLFPVFDYDLYWHLAFGREISQTGQILTQEVFSYTAPGRHFDNRYWLAQWLFFRIWESFGGAGLLGLKLLITALVATLLFLTSRRLGAGPAAAAVVTALAVLVGYYRFTERPELFSLLLFALLGFLLLSHQAGRLRAIWLAVIPAIMLTWDWLHGAAYGLAFLVAFVAIENARRMITGTPDGATIRALNRTLAVTLVVMALNPLGLLTYGVFLGHVAPSPATNPILEYRPVNWSEFKPFFFMLAWAALLCALRPRNIRIGQAAIVLALAVLAWRISRVTGIFALACAPFIASLLGSRLDEPAWRKRITAASLAVAALFVGGFGAWVKLGEPSPHSIGWWVDDQYLPAGTVRFIKDVGLDGRLYNTGDIGGYLALELFPERRIFQYNHGQMFGNTARFAEHPEEFARWNITYAVVSSPWELQALFPLREWARIYRDPGAVLVVRRLPQYAELIDRYELRHFHPMMPENMFYNLLDDSRSRHRLIRETSVYLAYRRDPRIAALLVNAMTRYPDAPGFPDIAPLLHSAVDFHEDVPGFRALIVGRNSAEPSVARH